MDKENIGLTASEMGYLWTSFQAESLGVCVLKYFESIVEDEEIKQIVKMSLDRSQRNVSEITKIFNKDNFPIPVGFTEQDVNVKAERLYTDSYILYYLWFIGKTNLNVYSVAINTIARSDVFSFYEQCINQSLELVKKSRETLLSKGLWIRSPYIPIPQETEFVRSQNFLNGWFGEQRKLNGMEISNLFYNSITNAIGIGLMTSFSQVTKDGVIKKYFLRGRDIAAKQVEVLTSALKGDNLPSPTAWDIGVTLSTEPPFSEKLMLYLVNLLNAQGIGNYGEALATSMRKDIALTFTRLSAEILAYAEDGANLLIEHGWMEQPPKAPDRDKIANR